MSSYFKILCGMIAFGIATYSVISKKPAPTVIVGCYWFAVTMYWVFNIIGG